MSTEIWCGHVDGEPDGGANQPVSELECPDEVSRRVRIWREGRLPCELAIHCRADAEVQGLTDDLQGDLKAHQAVGFNTEPANIDWCDRQLDESSRTLAGEVGNDVLAEAS